MAKFSSIHVRGISSGSEQHNRRERKLSYVRDDLSYLNSSFELKSIATAMAEVSAKYKATTGQKMQATAKPIREAVLLIEPHHGVETLKSLGKKIKQRFGIRTIQAYAHKDEGHYDKITGEWKPNYHAHMIFDWTDEKTGKAIRMSKDDLSELQTIVAEHLKMQRGVKSTKKHIESTKFKAIKEEEDLQKVYETKNLLPIALRVINDSKRMEKEIQPLKTQKNSLENEILVLKAQREQLEKEMARMAEIEQEKARIEEEKKQNRGFKAFGKIFRRKIINIIEDIKDTPFSEVNDRQTEKQPEKEEKVYLETWKSSNMYEAQIEERKERLKEKEQYELKKQMELKESERQTEKRQRKVFEIKVNNSKIGMYATTNDIDNLQKRGHMGRTVYVPRDSVVVKSFVSVSKEGEICIAGIREIQLPRSVNGRDLTAQEYELLLEGAPVLLKDLNLIATIDASTKSLALTSSYDADFRQEVIKINEEVRKNLAEEKERKAISDKKWSAKSEDEQLQQNRQKKGRKM